jgi:glycosyltransferase involved in cell wall biosynthesis
MSAGRAPEVRALMMMSSMQMGGGETNLVGFMPHLRDSGIRPLLCTLTTRLDSVLAATLDASGVPRRDLGARRMLDPHAWRQLARLVREEGIDIIHTHDLDTHVVATAVRRRVGVPVVMTRNVLVDQTDTWRRLLRSRLVFPVARIGSDQIVAVADAVARSFARRALLPRGRVTTIHTGIELERFAPALGRSEARAALGWDRERPTVVMVSVLRSGKGHEMLFRAIPGLARRIPGLAVKIVGAGEAEAELRRCAEPLGEVVEFAGQMYDDLPTALWASDVLVLPSRAEGLPIVLIEAAAAGLPVVATDVGGCSEVVFEGTTGYLVDKDDDRALADRLARILGDPAAARAMGAAARAMAEREFSLSQQARATADLYRRILSR